MIDPTGPWCWLNAFIPSQEEIEKQRREDREYHKRNWWWEIPAGCGCYLIGLSFFLAPLILCVIGIMHITKGLK